MEVKEVKDKCPSLENSRIITGDWFIDPKEGTKFYPLIICNIFTPLIAVSTKRIIFAIKKARYGKVERWIYLLKNMETLNRLPWAAQSAIFKKLESIADVVAMTRAERMQYDEVCRKIIKNIFFCEV